MADNTTLIATLGGQPQIITFTLDLLLQRGEDIRQVVVVYPAASPRYQQAYRQLMGEFIADEYAGRPCHLRSVPLHLGNDPDQAEAMTPRQVEVIHNVFQQLLGDLKEQEQHIHLSLSGGRRIIALIALETAMRFLSPMDRLWHIYTTPELTEQEKNGQMMHVPPTGGVSLIPVPFVPWAAYFPGLRPLLDRSPQEQRESELGWQSTAERAQCERVWQALTQRQKEVLRVLVSGLNRVQAARQLNVAISTLDTHRGNIIQQCQAVWEDDAALIDTQFLRQHFSPFIHSLEEV